MTGMSSRSAVACQDGEADDEGDGGAEMSGHDEMPAGEGPEDPEAADEPQPPTVVAEPVVLDLRDGVDTVAAYEADQARRAAAAQTGRG
jgi:hypothetical protein